jgi:dephospho-CoA kinase
LAGGVGSGKSTIARMMAQEGGFVIDADALARQAMMEPEVAQALAQWWGPQVLDEHGMPDRKRIGRIVFDDPSQRQRLEALIHPMVARRRAELIDQAQADHAVRFIVLDVPLLMEVGLDAMCDRIVFVDAPEALRRARVMAHRGWEERELERREKNQLPLDRKRIKADDIIVNDASEAAALMQVRHLLSRLLAKD